MAKPYWTSKTSKCPKCGGILKHTAPPFELVCDRCKVRLGYREYCEIALSNTDLELPEETVQAVFEKLYEEINK